MCLKTYPASNLSDSPPSVKQHLCSISSWYDWLTYKCSMRTEHMSSSLSGWQVFLMQAHHQGLNRISQHPPPISKSSATCVSVCNHYIISFNTHVFLSHLLSLCVQLNGHLNPHSQPNVPDWCLFPTLGQKQMTYIWNVFPSLSLSLFLFWREKGRQSS